MSDGISKPTHTNEDKVKYDAEYERIFGNKKLKAIAVTFEHDHSDLSELWENYYGKYMETKKVKIGDILRNDWGATTKLLNSLQGELFEDYDLIMFTDVDELIVPDPDKYKDLKDYLNQVDKDVVRCTGYNVIQMDEPSIDLTKPILKQRSYWSRDELYDKSVILTKPQVYTSNHHIIKEPIPDPELIMFHLRDMDIEMTKERNKKVGAKYNEQDLEYRKSIATEIPKKYRGII